MGKLNLEKELLLISYLDVMLSMDSANMHLASLVQVPVVSIWGATHPSLGFYGFNQDLNNVVQIDLDCRPCSVYGNLPCQRGDYVCLERISEDLVISHIHKVLEQKNT
jgi:ADP-heptose:LPS heptosyltransferase